MKVDRLDYLVLTVASIDTTVAWYERVLGMKAESIKERWALRFGSQKINLHQRGHEFEPKALRPTPGSGDLCFLTDVPLTEVSAHWQDCEVLIVEGPVPRTGARGPMLSVYCRDPDGNLIEVSNVQ